MTPSDAPTAEPVVRDPIASERGPTEAVREDPAPSWPIHYLSARWREADGEEGTGGAYRMFREPPSVAEREQKLLELMDGYRERRDVEEVLHLEAEYRHHETWCVSWFQHWTFDVGQSDRDALVSFRRYVDRHRWYQRHGYSLDDEARARVREWLGHDPICLMGAEDRHRWTATPEGSGLLGPGEGQADPPCRCEHCQEQGVLRIDH